MEYRFTFDDTLQSQKWSTRTKDGRFLVISHTPEATYVDMLGGGALDKWAPNYKHSSLPLTIRDPRLAGLSAINRWGYESLKELGDLYRKKLLITREHDGALIGTVSVVSNVPYASGYGRDGEEFSYSLARRFEIDSDTLLVAKMKDTFRTADGSVFDYFANESTVEYGHCDEVMVPVHWNGMSKSGDAFQNLDVTMKWISANRGIDPDLFGPDGLGLPGGTLVVDRRLGDPIVVSTIPRDGVDDLPGRDVVLETIGAAPFGGWRRLVLGVHCAVIAALLWLIIRARLAARPV
jgi:hypothetical protein